MKIAIVNTHICDFVGGSQLQCDLIATELSARGHDVHYIAVQGRGGAPYPRHYSVHPVAHSARAIGHACIGVRPDVVYWRYNKKCLFGAARRLAKVHIPIVFSVSHVADTQKWSSKVVLRPFSVKRLCKRLRDLVVSRWNYRGFRYVDALVANNSQHLSFLAGLPQIHISNSIPRSFTSVAATQLWPRQYCVWVSNVKPQKRPEYYIELARRLQLTGVDFLMIGSNTSGRPFPHPTDKPPTNFHYLGAKSGPEVSAYLSQCLMLVHTCLPEGFPNVFIQAWAHGKPVVSMDFDPDGRLSREGLGRSSANFETFVQDVREFIHEDELRGTVGKRARDYVSGHCSIESNVILLEEFIQSTLSDQNDRIRTASKRGLSRLHDSPRLR
jgi:glycosyltransferase involved in cell wall biosynthesis